MSKPRVISGDQAGKAETWRIPDVAESVIDATGHVKSTGGSLLTAERLALIEEEAHREGYQHGKREGLEKGLSEGRAMINERLATLDTVIQALQSPLQNLDDLVENDLVELVFSIARQLIRREINTQPDQIIAVIRDSLGVLPTGARDIRVFLHPEDAKLARELMSLSEQEQVWKIIEDPSLTRGGCRVQTEHSRVDATVESRLNEVIASVLGDERQLALQDKDDEPR